MSPHIKLNLYSETVRLNEVPETMLWTLHNRANEAMRDDGCIYDPKCIQIYEAIDYDYERSFGKADGSHAVRASAFDHKIQQFINLHPDAVIINLGEGLETQRYRIAHSGKVLWVTVDMEEAVTLREYFIQPDDQHLHIRCNVLDTQWFASIPDGRPIFISAQGLFMYFNEAELRPLFYDLSRHFADALLMFDYISPYLSARTMSAVGWRKTPYYRTPNMPWGITRSQLQPTISDWIGYPVKVNDVSFSFPRGMYRYLIPFLEMFPMVNDQLPGMCWLQFSPRPEPG